MSKKTVKQLKEDIEILSKDIGGVHVHEAICYHWEQVAATLEELDRYGELIKMEITHGNQPGKKDYRVTTWHKTLLNEENRKEIRSKGFYEGLKQSTHRYFPPTTGIKS